jgi:hypothetical protein
MRQNKQNDKNREFTADMANGENLPTPENAFKDELNLAEFPIAALTDRIPDGQTTLVFEDRLDQKEGPPIVRRLTIMAPSKHGLPAAVDDEVIVGLIQLTKRRNNFTDPKVSFSRYELIELLGWPQTGPSYRRVEEALHRWVGVVLMYENAWWDNSAKSWVDENFHILEHVTLYDQERRLKRLRSGNAEPPLQLGRLVRPTHTNMFARQGPQVEVEPLTAIEPFIEESEHPLGRRQAKLEIKLQIKLLEVAALKTAENHLVPAKA